MKRNRRFQKYGECINYLFDLERVGIKYDLINIKKLCKFLGNPQTQFKSIHIAGTNGKGSVAAILNSALMEMHSFLRWSIGTRDNTLPLNPPPKGEETTPKPPLTKGDLNIGLYTSPHIIDFRERILVNGNYISKSYIIDFTNRVYDFIRNMNISFFEVTTAMAFDYFRYCKVKYALIEAGLGGRLDSTNILKPILTIITGISIDHTEYLGNSIETIAKEKAGIIKKNVPCVIGEVNNNVKKIFKSIAEKKNSRIIFSKPGRIIKVKEINGYGIKFNVNSKFLKLKDVRLPLTGQYQIRNIVTSLTALSILNITEVTENARDLRIRRFVNRGAVRGFVNSGVLRGMERVVENSKIFGRFQFVNVRPKIIIDVSHNPEALGNLKNNLKNIKYRNLYIIFGIMKDKNYKESLRIIEGLDGFVVLTRAEYKRALEPEVMYEYITDLNDYNDYCDFNVSTLEHRNEREGTLELASASNEGRVREVKKKNKLNKFVVINNIKDSFEFIKKRIKKNDLLLVTGSFFVVSEFLKISKMKLE